jgi:hypothetical protein
MTCVEEAESPAGALEQTSAEPLDCFVRLPCVMEGWIRGVLTSGRAAARTYCGKFEEGLGSAATSSGMRTLGRVPVVIRRKFALGRL